MWFHLICNINYVPLADQRGRTNGVHDHDQRWAKDVVPWRYNIFIENYISKTKFLEGNFTLAPVCGTKSHLRVFSCTKTIFNNFTGGRVKDNPWKDFPCLLLLLSVVMAMSSDAGHWDGHHPWHRRVLNVVHKVGIVTCSTCGKPKKFETLLIKSSKQSVLKKKYPNDGYK